MRLLSIRGPVGSTNGILHYTTAQFPSLCASPTSIAEVSSTTPVFYLYGVSKQVVVETIGYILHGIPNVMLKSPGCGNRGRGMRRRKAVTSPGFSFSAAGLLFPYHIGVAHLLIEKGYIKETTPLAGSSAGAVVCAVIASGSSMEEALKATKILAEDCRLRGTAFRLGAVLREMLDQFLPDDAHIRSNGRVRVAVTEVQWKPRGLLVDHFDSKEDLIDALFTSSFIPGYLAPRPATMFRNRLCIDGGLTLFMPPTSAAQTVRVCAFPASQLGIKGIGISPDCNPENTASPRELFNWALEPAADDVLDRLFELGYLDAAVWAETNPVEDIVRDDSGADLESSPTK